jgi:hypothetical protein
MRYLSDSSCFEIIPAFIMDVDEYRFEKKENEKKGRIRV